MLATAGSLPSGDGGWAYEMKWDGVRAIAFVERSAAALWSRTGREITQAYPELQELAAGRNAARAVLDGEIVAFGGAVHDLYGSLTSSSMPACCSLPADP